MRPEAWPRVRLPAPEAEQELPQVLPEETHPRAPREVGPHKSVVDEYDEFVRCLWTVASKRARSKANSTCPTSAPGVLAAEETL
eukprot:529648-Amphidinium_carterae.1